MQQIIGRTATAAIFIFVATLAFPSDLRAQNDAAKTFKANCTLCHGDPAHPKAPLIDSLNPPAPQFMDDKADMAENQNFFILQHGIRWTAMPGWKNVLNDQQLWQLVTFLSRMSDLPPATKQVFSETAPQTQPAAGSH